MSQLDHSSKLLQRPQPQVGVLARFTNAELDKLKVHDTVICTSYIVSGKCFFKPALFEKPAGTVVGESKIVEILVRDI